MKNKLAPFDLPRDEMLGAWLTTIHGGIVYTGINIDELDSDLQMILDKGVMNKSDLVELCNRLEKVNQEVSLLYNQIERILPHKTNGYCHGLGNLGRNRLLSMLMRINDTRISFTGGIDIVRKRVLAILKRREKEEESKYIDALDKSGLHDQMEIDA